MKKPRTAQPKELRRPGWLPVGAHGRRRRSGACGPSCSWSRPRRSHAGRRTATASTPPTVRRPYWRRAENRSRSNMPFIRRFSAVFFPVAKHPIQEALFSYSHNGSTTNHHPRKQQQRRFLIPPSVSATDSSLTERAQFYCLLMEQAAVSVVTPESVQPIGVWSMVRSERLDRGSHIKGVGNGFSRADIGDAGIHGLAIQSLLTTTSHRTT